MGLEKDAPPLYDLACPKPLARTSAAAAGGGRDGVEPAAATPDRRDDGHWLNVSGIRTFVLGACHLAGRARRGPGRATDIHLQLASIRRFLAATWLGARSTHRRHARDGHPRRLADLHLQRRVP